MSKRIEKLIVSPEFQYLQPYFYLNPYALRCELGMGEGGEYMRNARRRAMEIHDILMPGGADAVIFNYRMVDYAESGPAEGDGDEYAASMNERYVEREAFCLRFLLDMMLKYRHDAVKGLRPESGESGDNGMGGFTRTRMVCWSDGRGFDDAALIDMQLKDEPMEIGLVSLANQCILSVYDDRGCDITFAGKTKMREFFSRLKPYFLPYDMEEMERRYREAKTVSHGNTK